MHRSVLLWALGALPLAAAEFQPVAPIEAEDEIWSGVMAPGRGPDRDGQATVALRWEPAKHASPNSPALLLSWADVAALRFRLYQEQPRPFKLNLVLTGRSNGYFLAAVPLDFAGWKQFTLPVGEFAKVRDADLATTTTLGFRAQGYGQPALEPGWVLWVDDLEVLPQEGKTLPRTNSLEVNRAAWLALVAQGNPLLLLNAQRYAAPQPAFQAPTITSTWQYRTTAEQLLSLAYAACDPASPHRGRQDLVDLALATCDWLVTSCHEDGWWWNKGPVAGDPNVNRFTLGPLLDAVRYLRLLPAGEAAWPRWQARLDRAIDLQRRAYRGEVDWDWGGLAGGEYANQDAYYVLVMALSALLYDRPADQALAADMMRKVAENVLPDGGIHYIGVEMESPIYHSLNLIIFGRYATLTKDPVVVKMLADTANYWPLTCTAEGYPESWSDVWWKQNWGMPWREAMVVAAGATHDARNQYLLWRVLERSAPSDGGMGGLYAAPYWTGAAPGEAPPARRVVVDRNILGVRGHDGPWAFGVTRGRGLRNTFVGGLITSPRAVNPLQAAFRGASIDVLTDPKQTQGLFLSQVDDRAGVALRPHVAGAVGVRYRPQPRTINGWPVPTTPDTPWQVTQVWRAAGDGCLGLVALEALADTQAAAVVGRVALGPRQPELRDGVWYCGPLKVVLLQQFGEVSVQPVPHYTTPLANAWPGLQLRQELPGGARAGQSWVYAVWVGPSSATPPTRFEPLPDDRGWVAQLAAGRRVAAIFNGETRSVELTLPDLGNGVGAFTGDGGQAVPLAVVGAGRQVMLSPAQCVLVE